MRSVFFQTNKRSERQERGGTYLCPSKSDSIIFSRAAYCANTYARCGSVDHAAEEVEEDAVCPRRHRCSRGGCGCSKTDGVLRSTYDDGMIIKEGSVILLLRRHHRRTSSRLPDPSIRRRRESLKRRLSRYQLGFPRERA